MKIRLFVEEELKKDAEIQLNEKQVHYLFHVLKATIGEKIFCFNNKSGEFECEIAELSKKACKLRVSNKTKAFEKCPNIWLLFAPIKKDNTDFVVEKATELGVREIIPVITERTNADRIKTERMHAQVIEASEQCERTDIPIVREAIGLKKVLQDWDSERTLFFMDESLGGDSIFEVLKSNKNPKAAVLIGPEGGFSQKEREFIKSLSFAKPVSLGQRILRAETAAIAALTCWQAINGDWQ